MVDKIGEWSVALFTAGAPEQLRRVYGCMCMRHCGLIGNGCSQVNQDFSCVRNMNCCSAHCTDSDCELILSHNFGCVPGIPFP